MDTLEEIQELKNAIQNMQAQLILMDKTISSLESKFNGQSVTTPFASKRINDFQVQETLEPIENLSLQSCRTTLKDSANFPGELNPPADRTVPKHSALEKSHQQSSQASSSDLISEFNNLPSRSTYEAKLARNEFVKKYNVKFINCANHEARMNEPIPPPKFVEVEAVEGGEYWAVPLRGNTFAVLPRIKTYTSNYHKARAAGEVFHSNFKSGNTYTEIKVEKPAIFECTGSAWFCNKQGVLNLR